MNGTSPVRQAPANPEPQGFTQVTIDTIRQIRHMSTEAALFLLYRLRTDRTDTGAWTSTIADDADMIGASPSSVKAARRKLAERGHVELWPTVSSGGDNGPDIIVVVENVPEGKTAEDAAREHAVARRMRLRRDARAKVTVRQDSVPRRSAVRQDSISLRDDTDEGVETGFGPTARGETGTCPTSTQTTGNQTTPTNNEHRSAQVASDQCPVGRGWQVSWIEVLRDALAFVKVDLGMGALSGYARLLKACEDEHGPAAAANWLDEVVMAVEDARDGRRAPERVVHLAFAFDDGHLDGDHPFSIAVGKELPNLWTVVRWAGGGCTWPGDPEAEIESCTADELRERHGGELVELDYSSDEADVIERDNGDTWSITSNRTTEQRAERDAQIRREFGAAPVDEQASEEPEWVASAADTRRSELVAELEALEARLRDAARSAHRLDYFQKKQHLTETVRPLRAREAELRATLARIDAERSAVLVRTDDAPHEATPATGEIPTESRDEITGDGTITDHHTTKEALNR